MNTRVFVAVVLVFAAHALACLWDRDTLRAESRGLPGMVEIITGRIHRHPALYYEMRLDRVTERIAETPDDLAAYDDAAVALDRLGRSTEAIEVMAAKRAQLDLAPDAEHEYRYLANLGTFHAHRWLRAGADREDMADLIEAERLIAAAIELNPEAHFGREKYQLLAIRWLIDPEPTEHRLFSTSLFDDPGALWSSHAVADEAVEGLSGLMVLGDAWESIDVIYSLGVALNARDDAALAELARLRCFELKAAGRQSMHPLAQSGDPDLEEMFWSEVELVSMHATRQDDIAAFFDIARAEADQWRADKLAYELERLEAGRHPDTDAAFWDDWVETPPPAPPGKPLSYYTTLAALIAVPLLIVVTPVVGLVWFCRRAMRQPT